MTDVIGVTALAIAERCERQEPQERAEVAELFEDAFRIAFPKPAKIWKIDYVEWSPEYSEWQQRQCDFYEYLESQAFLNAAVELVPEGFDWLVRNDTGEKFAHVTRDFTSHITVCGGETFNTSTGRSFPVYAASTALALCAAAMKARAASADTRPEGGDSTEIEAPFTSGAVPNGETPQ